MPCTTILVGKSASYDGSTMIARNDDGHFDAKKLIVVDAKNQPKKYKSIISHLEIELPDNPLSYTSCPSIDQSEGIWATCGINSLNVSMTATETITSNPRVIGADPYVKYVKAKSENEQDIPGGIGEEDIVVLVLPYIHSAREGVERLGSLLEKYGTYEPNGIAFSDCDEIWWLETIGGHNWIARRVMDNEYVIMPNQFGLDRFSLNDAFGAKINHLASSGLKSLIENNHLNLNMNGDFNPRLAFGSHDDSDHVYNTPRAWYMGRYFNPRTFKWDGPDATYTPQSDDIPWALIPERKITVEDVKYILSSYFQGTPFNPYGKDEKKGIYRSIGINRTGCMAINQIRGYLPKAIAAVEWICFGSNAFNTIIPLYTNTLTMPDYVSKVSLEVTTDNFYWNSRIIAALADAHYSSSIIYIERYQKQVMSRGHELLNKFDSLFLANKDSKTIAEANAEICLMAKEETSKTLNSVLYDASAHMKNGYNRADN